jgi:hypothetical protein
MRRAAGKYTDDKFKRPMSGVPKPGSVNEKFSAGLDDGTETIACLSA